MRKWLCVSETLSEEHNFGNQTIIGNHHTNRSEEYFQVIREFRSSGVPRVHSDEHPIAVSL